MNVRALVTSLCVPTTLASAAQYSRRVWRIEDGLPQNKIQAFAQTPDGYLWIGTSGGLVRFDGARFTVFDRSNTPALRDDSILSILSTRDGSLWIGTEGGGLARMRKGAFQGYGASEGLTNGFVRVFLEDSQARLWVGTDRGFFRFDGNRFLRLDGKAGTPPLAAHAVFEDTNHTIQVGTSYGLFHVDGDTLAQQSDGTSAMGDITSIFETSGHSLWLASVTGLRRMEQGKLATDSTLARINARRIYPDHSGNIWVGAVSGGLSEFPPAGSSKPSTFTAPDPLPDNTVLAIFEDAQRNLWVGTQDGLVRLTETTVRTFNSKDGLTEDNVTTVYCAPDRKIWLSTTSGLIYHLEGNRFVGFPAPSIAPDFRPRNTYVSRDNVQWIGSSAQGFLRIENGKAKLFTMADGLRSNGIRDFLQVRDGTMWIATGSGLSHWDGRTMKTFYVEDGLAYGGVRVLAEDANGDLLVGTDGGVNRVHQNRFVRDPVFTALGNVRVWSILPDTEGVLWMGARGDGLLRVEGAHITHFTTREGLPSNSIYQVLDDHTGRLWMSSAAGVFSVDKKELTAFAQGRIGPLAVIPYDTDDGMLSSQMNGGAQAAGSRDADGNLWFPSVKGAVKIDPQQLRMSPAAPVLVESLVADEQPIQLDKAVSIAPGGNRIEIDFTSPNLAAPDRVSFQYMLEGFDKTWIHSLKRRAAYYTNLPPHRYTFHVLAKDVAQPGRTSEASLVFDLQPHFYETVWFYALAIAALLLATFGIVRFYARQTKARYALVLAERTRLAREMHDTVIQGCVGVSALLEAVRSMPPSAQAKSKDLIDRAASQIRLTVNEAREAVWDLRHSNIEHGLVETLQDFAQQVSASEGIPVRIQVEGQPASLDETAGRNLLLMAREAVRNAVMHGAPNHIGVKLLFEASAIRVEVTDDGRGFRPEQPRPEGHYGIVGMRERVEQSGGMFELHSVPGAGTNVIATLPLGKQSNRKNAGA